MSDCSRNWRRVNLSLLASSLLLVVGAGYLDPKIGFSVDYQAMQPTMITGLWIDDRKLIGRSPGSSMWVSPKASKHVALPSPPGSAGLHGTVRATWRYAAPDPIDEAAWQALSDDELPWREAQGTVVLSETTNPDSMALLREDPEHHRLELIILFNHDRLEVRWEVQRRVEFRGLKPRPQ